ncbi:MAG: hypothetical protein R3F19_19470 [Verrucomicrobiales bacterium]
MRFVALCRDRSWSHPEWAKSVIHRRAGGGAYYLPYRLHATVSQFRRAYPMRDQFLAARHRYDPEGVFAHRFAGRYLDQ